MEQADKAIFMTMRKGGIPEATVWGSGGGKVPVEEACFANGTLADLMDWEDCSCTGHPSAGAIPVSFAMCEALGCTGKDYITAVTAGYEVYHRIAMAIQPTLDQMKTGRGWGITSWQIYACAIPAAKLLNLPVDKVAQTIGAAYHQTIINVNKHSRSNAKSDIYHYTHGFVARNGVVSAQIADLGYENCYDALDGPNGLWRMLSDQVDWEWHTRELGSRYYILDTYLKHWPANMWVQAPLDILASLQKEHGFTKDDIKEIRVSPILPFIMGDYSQSTRGVLDAQFSIPYCLTAYLMDPNPGMNWFTKEMRNSQEIIEFSKKFTGFGETTSPFANFEIFKKGGFPTATLEVVLNNGDILARTIQFPKGHANNQFTMEEEAEHFRRCAAGYLSPEEAGRVLALVDDLENLDNFDELAKLMAIPGRKNEVMKWSK